VGLIFWVMALTCRYVRYWHLADMLIAARYVRYLG
jgi:hypothetical protein